MQFKKVISVMLFLLMGVNFIFVNSSVIDELTDDIVVLYDLSENENKPTEIKGAFVENEFLVQDDFLHIRKTFSDNNFFSCIYDSGFISKGFQSTPERPPTG